MDHDDADLVDDCCCEQTIDTEGKVVLIPSANCELHWRQVIKSDLPPAHLFP